MKQASELLSKLKGWKTTPSRAKKFNLYVFRFNNVCKAQTAIFLVFLKKLPQTISKSKFEGIYAVVGKVLFALVLIALTYLITQY